MQPKPDELPALSIKGITFFPVPEFDGPTAAFGAPESAYLPRRDLPQVPRKFKELAAMLFYSGGMLPADMSSRVDRGKALKAVSAWLRSFAPPHESKMATVAYALWVWSTLDQIEQQKAA